MLYLLIYFTSWPDLIESVCDLFTFSTKNQLASNWYRLIVCQVWTTVLGTLDSRVVFALNFDHWYAVPGLWVCAWWWQTLFRTQARHQHFFHNSILFIWFDTNFCLSNLSWELWSRKLKIKKLFSKKFNRIYQYLVCN